MHVTAMIVSFRHKGLEELFKKGSSKKINPQHQAKLVEQMSILDSLVNETDILIYLQWFPHKLSGKNSKGKDVEGHWSLKVSGNWRLTYCFEPDGNVVLLDYIDYH